MRFCSYRVKYLCIYFLAGFRVFLLLPWTFLAFFCTIPAKRFECKLGNKLKISLIFEITRKRTFASKNNTIRKARRKQEWRSSESARLPPMWPGFYSVRVPYVGGVCCWFSTCSEGFSTDSPVFPSLQKPTSLHVHSNSTRTEDPRENQLRLMCLTARIFLLSSNIYSLVFSKYCNLLILLHCLPGSTQVDRHFQDSAKKTRTVR